MERLEREPITGEPRRRGESISTRPVIAVHVTLSTLLGDDEPDVGDVTTWIGPHHTSATSGVPADLDPDPPW